jgi:peptidoglycan/xylan/chitin deacetylase (PgdA/CDA1 family)
MRIAFTMDDLPIYPHLALPDDYTPASVADSVARALERHEVSGVYAFANSWPLDVQPETAAIYDAWTSAGHFVGNHTHSHPLLNDFSSEDFIADIDSAEELLQPWLKRSPEKLFRHPLNLWGNTEEKRAAVTAHIAKLDYAIADVTSYLFEWEWDRAWRWLQQTGKTEEAEDLKSAFVEFSIAQMAYDQACCREVFGHDVIGIALAHYVAFFAEVADPLLARMRREGIQFVPLAEAIADPAYKGVASIVTDSFHVYQQKMSAAAGREIAPVAPGYEGLMKRIFELATPLRPVRRGGLVQNKRGPNP